MNRHAAYCPECSATICLRCVALDAKMDPDGLDGCAECEAALKRTRRAKRKHIEQDHEQPAATSGESTGDE